MRERRTVLRYGARFAIVALIAGSAAGCVKRHEEPVTSVAATTPESAPGAYGSTGPSHDHGAAVRHGDHMHAGDYDHGTMHHGTCPPSPCHHAATAAHRATAADHHLTSRVRHALAANEQTKTVAAEAHHGVVTLSGHVRKASQKRRAEEIASKVTGVKHVHNAIHVKG